MNGPGVPLIEICTPGEYGALSANAGGGAQIPTVTGSRLQSWDPELIEDCVGSDDCPAATARCCGDQSIERIGSRHWQAEYRPRVSVLDRKQPETLSSAD